MVQLGIIKEDKTMSDNINNTNPPSEPLTRVEQFLSAIAGVTSSNEIPEEPLTRIEEYLNKIVENGGGGGGGGTVNNAKITIQKNGTTVDSFTSNQATDKTINITVPTSAADVSALPDTTKYAAALSLTINSSTFVVTGQLIDQDGNDLGTAQTIDLPLESVVVDGSYNSQTKKVVLTLQNGNTIEFSVADLVSGLQTELSASNKLNPAYINYDSTHAAVTEAQRDQIETNKNNILSTCCVGTCTTAGNVAAKDVTISDNSWTPHKGSIIAVKFSYSNNVVDTESTPITLNVNNTGAYRIWYKNGEYVNASQGKIFGYAGYYVYYMFDGVDRWLWVNYSMDNTYSTMSQSEASAGTATNEHLITAKVLSDTIDEKLAPVENNIFWANNYGYKNLIKRTKAEIKAANPSISWTGDTSNVVGGLIFTINDDLSITINGTTTATVIEFNLQTRAEGKTIFKQVGEYRIDGKMQAGYGMFAANRTVGGSGVRYGADEGETATFTVEQSDLSAPVGIWWGYNGVVGKAFNNVTIYPMICLSTMDRTYQPYCPSNYELYQMILALQ